MDTLYIVKFNRTAADVVASNDETYTVYATLEDAQMTKLGLERAGYCAVWIEIISNG